MAQIHRLGDTVAVYLGNGETAYLTPEKALEIAEAMTKCADDILTRPPADSQFSTARIEAATGKNDHSQQVIYRQKQNR